MNKIQLYKKAKNIVNTYKIKAEEKAEEVLDNALTNVKFKTNYQNIKNLEFEIAKLEFNKLDTKMQKELLSVLKKERATILKDLKLKEEDFLPKYNCKTCEDTGIHKNQTCNCVKAVMAKLINNQMHQEQFKKTANIFIVQADLTVTQILNLNISRLAQVFSTT